MVKLRGNIYYKKKILNTVNINGVDNSDNNNNKKKQKKKTIN